MDDSPCHENNILSRFLAPLGDFASDGKFNITFMTNIQIEVLERENMKMFCRTEKLQRENHKAQTTSRQRWIGQSPTDVWLSILKRSWRSTTTKAAHDVVRSLFVW